MALENNLKIHEVKRQQLKTASSSDKNFWIFLREILLSEDGYIRYDYDEKGYNLAREEGQEHRHPLHHYDIFYTNKATFKLGLHSSISESDFYHLLNVKTDCKHLSDFI